jgi:hypothetical protein
MSGYDTWIEHVNIFKEKFGADLEIYCCELRIEDFPQNYPQEVFSVIQMPIHYLFFLNLHSNLILCNQNIFRKIGTPDNENLNHENFSVQDYIFNIKKFLETHINSCQQVPIDNRRKYHAGLLRDMMTYFSIYHEIGHIRQKNFSYNLEDNESEVDLNDDLKWQDQAEEIDADIFGIKFLWRTVFYNFHQLQDNNTLITSRELITLSLYSTFLFFYLSNNDEALNNPLKKHPHPIVRFSIISKELQPILELNEFCDKKEFEFIIQTVLHEFDTTLDFHFHSANKNEYYKKFFDPSIAEVEKEIKNHMIRNPSLNINRPYILN